MLFLWCTKKQLDVVNGEHWSREMWPVNLGGFTPWNILTYGAVQFSEFLEKNRIHFHLKFYLLCVSMLLLEEILSG